MSTKYTINAGTTTFSKKAVAIDAALAIRNDERIDVVVTTDKGTVVFEAKAPKKIRMSKPYTRVVDLPADFEAPEGFRVCYTRPRKGLAVLHNFDEDYRILNLKTGKILPEIYPTTRAAGRALADA